MRTFNPRILILSLLLIALLASSAIANAAGVPTPDEDAPAWALALYTAITSGEWKLAGGLVLLGLTWLVRSWGVRLIPWLGTSLGGIVLAFVLALASTFGLALATGASFTLASVAVAIGTAATAAGVWEWLRSYFPPAATSSDKIKAAALPKATIDGGRAS